eukprot:CAMPEP_0198291140 /NCGR_PEP_ID=MMETSP1449-20131203/8771_1 /TAXON_ID=420275 /ORGANISM="Attheya septentrionalis, Strain CCMP2084" /LENGTH=248 /DNA_ID=CAMNT_0043989745 /DNA_START=243 /DNA_END=989 /DNA_ORIENTATION=+
MPTAIGQSSKSVDYDVSSSLVSASASATTTNNYNNNTFTQLSEGYSRLTKDHYLLMAFCQAGFLASAADVATQTMEVGGGVGALAIIDFGHVAAMAMVASTMSGAMNAVWLRQLEQAFPGKAPKEVAAKTLIHAVILASIINSAYLVGVPLFTDCISAATTYSVSMPNLMNPSVMFEGWHFDEFVTLTKLEVMMFIPYNTLAFTFVPPSIRPLTHATISATFNIAVSAVTLGCFGTWCDNAMSFFGGQ